MIMYDLSMSSLLCVSNCAAKRAKPYLNSEFYKIYKEPQKPQILAATTADLLPFPVCCILSQIWKWGSEQPVGHGSSLLPEKTFKCRFDSFQQINKISIHFNILYSKMIFFLFHIFMEIPIMEKLLGSKRWKQLVLNADLM